MVLLANKVKLKDEIQYCTCVRDNLINCLPYKECHSVILAEPKSYHDFPGLTALLHHHVSF